MQSTDLPLLTSKKLFLGKIDWYGHEYTDNLLLRKSFNHTMIVKSKGQKKNFDIRFVSIIDRNFFKTIKNTSQNNYNSC